MNLKTAQTLTDGHIGEVVTVVLTTGDAITGTLKGVNTRGIRVLPEGATKETTRGLTKVADIHLLSEPADDGEEVEDSRTERDYESEVAAFFTEDVVRDSDMASADENPDGGEMDDTRNEDEYDFEGPMTIVTMEGGVVIEAEDVTVPDDASAITSEPPALPGSVSTPRELAEVFGVSAFDIRQALRSLGLNVGKGKKYDLTGLTATQLTKIREKVTAK